MSSSPEGGLEVEVASASYRGLKEVNGQRLAEVEVHTTEPGGPEWLVYFRKGPKGYQLVSVLENDARTDTDWFDNTLHEAFRDVTTNLFNGPSHVGSQDRSEFAEQVLETDDVRADLDLHFNPS